jgi:hypothetical protein
MKVELSGLKLKHPACAMATAGLFEVFPNAIIDFKFGFGTYYPVIDCGMSITGIVDHLSDSATWKKLNMPPDISGVDLDDTEFTLPDYMNLLKVDPDLATGIATDLRLAPAKKSDNLAVSRSPFYMLSRQSTYATQVANMIGLVQKSSEKTKRYLTGPFYELEQGYNFGYFPDDSPFKVFKNSKPKKAPGTKLAKKAKDEKTNTSVCLTAPVIALLAVASWKMFPTFMSTGRIMSPRTIGWHNGDLYYPVFNRPVTRQEFLTWFAHPGLKNFSRHKIGWKKIGIEGVYRTAVRLLNQGSKAFVFSELSR